jgi:hypothetical protein
MLRCGSCGRALTGERHARPNGEPYIYYRCAGGHASVCPEKPIRKEAFEIQLIRRLGMLRMPHAVLEFLERRTRTTLEEERQRRETVRNTLAAALVGVRREEENLLSLRLRELVDDPTFLSRRSALQDQRRGLENRLAGVDANAAEHAERVTRILNFATRAQAVFASGTIFQRREILEAVSAKTTVRAKKVSLELKIPFQLVADSGACHNWRSLVDDVRKWLDEKTEYFALPDLDAEPEYGALPPLP